MKAVIHAMNVLDKQSIIFIIILEKTDLANSYAVDQESITSTSTSSVSSSNQATIDTEMAALAAKKMEYNTMAQNALKSISAIITSDKPYVNMDEPEFRGKLQKLDIPAGATKVPLQIPSVTANEGDDPALSKGANVDIPPSVLTGASTDSKAQVY